MIVGKPCGQLIVSYYSWWYSASVNWIISSGFLQMTVQVFTSGWTGLVDVTWILSSWIFYLLFQWSPVFGGACSVSAPVFHLPLWYIASVFLWFSQRSFFTSNGCVKFVFSIWPCTSVFWDFCTWWKWRYATRITTPLRGAERPSLAFLHRCQSFAGPQFVYRLFWQPSSFAGFLVVTPIAIKFKPQ